MIAFWAPASRIRWRRIWAEFSQNLPRIPANLTPIERQDAGNFSRQCSSTLASSQRAFGEQSASSKRAFGKADAKMDNSEMDSQRALLLLFGAMFRASVWASVCGDVWGGP